MTTPNLTGATIEVILADRTRARISLTELFEHLVANANHGSNAAVAKVADIVNPQANTLFVTNDFVEAVAKADDGTNAAVAKVVKKVAAKAAGKKAGSGDAT